MDINDIDQTIEEINAYNGACEEGLMHVKDHVPSPKDAERLRQLFASNCRNCQYIVKNLWQAKYSLLERESPPAEYVNRLLKITSDWLKSEFYGSIEGDEEIDSHAFSKINACMTGGKGLSKEYVKYLNDKFRNIAENIGVQNVQNVPAQNVPILLISALPEEMDALLAKLDQLPEVFKKRGVEQGIELLDQKSRETIAVLHAIGDTGNKASREATKNLIKIHNPQLVILFGIAAGIRGRVEIGNILITSRVLDMRKCKIEQFEFGLEPEQINSPVHISFPFRINRLKERLGDIFATDISIITDHVCGSSDNLIRSRAYMGAAAKTHRKLGAMEMEAAGMAEICKSCEISFFIVKSITDYGENGKDDTYHQFCYELAACTLLCGFLFPYIKGRWTV